MTSDAPSKDERVVDSLDDVTRESEEKAGEVFDILELLSADLESVTSKMDSIKNELEKNVETFSKLNKSFPEVETITTRLQGSKDALDTLENISVVIEGGVDHIMGVMDVMQYQDIHRQKIERVVNFIRQLAGYLDNLFSSERKDEERAPSAQMLPGDEEDSMSEDDLEALLASFGK